MCKPVKRVGHPLVCHLPGTECVSALRVLSNASVHYRKLAVYLTKVYTARRSLRTIDNIDHAIESVDYQMLLDSCKVTLFTLFQKKNQGDCQSDENKPIQTKFRTSHVEASLLTSYDKLIRKFDKTVRSYAILPCVSCEQLFRRDQCTRVASGDFGNNSIWLQMKEHACAVDPNVFSNTTFMCHYCKSRVKCLELPPRAAINGLQSVPMPEEA